MKRAEFEAAFYGWCQEQVRLEVASDFPALRSVKGSGAQNSVAAFLDVPSADRESLALLVLARWHGRKLGDAEKKRVDAFTIGRLGRGLPVNIQSYSIDTRHARRLFRERAKDVLGTMTSTPSYLKFELSVRGGTILTLIEVRRSMRQIAFEQWVRLENDPGPMSYGISNPMAWHGLARETYWDQLSKGEEESAVLQVVTFGRRFKDVACELLR